MDRGLAGWTLNRVCVRVQRGGTRLYPQGWPLEFPAAGVGNTLLCSAGQGTL